MKTNGRFRKGLESGVEDVFFTREEGMQVIKNLMQELNDMDFKFDSGFLDRMLPFTQFNLNQVPDKIKDILAQAFGTVRYKEYDPTSNRPHWTENPRHQITLLLQFLCRKLEVGKRSGDYDQIKRSLEAFARKEKIDLDLIDHESVSQAMEVIFNVLFRENLAQKKTSQLLALRLLPEEFSLRIIKVLDK